MIITIARECGSSGYEIGKGLAEKLGIEFYDKAKLTNLVKEQGNYEEHRDFFEETPMNSLLYSIAMGMGESTVQSRTFDMIRNLVKGKDFVMIGRCSNYMFREEPGVTSVFIHAAKDKRIEKVMEAEGLSRKQAEKEVTKTDENRAAFHEHCTEEQWGAAKHYHLCLDSGAIGVQNAIDVIAQFAKCQSEIQ